MTTYGILLVKFTIKMNLVLLWFATLILVISGVRTEGDIYPEVTPDEYVIEQLERFLRAQDKSEPSFSYRLPEPSVGEQGEATFAVGPPDPRYYDDTRFQPEDAASQLTLFPRNSATPVDSVEMVLDEAEVTSTAPALDEDEDENDEDYGEEEEMTSSAIHQQPVPARNENSDLYFIAIVAGCCAAAVVGIIAIGISWYRLQKNAKAAADVEYPAYGVTGPNKEVSPTGDRRLAQSAQMYHYQHQKQQIIAMESRLPADRNGSVSEVESEEENEEGDYTVYECPGLAPTGEMEVKNPLFHDDPTPATPAPSKEAAAATGDAKTQQKQQP